MPWLTSYRKWISNIKPSSEDCKWLTIHRSVTSIIKMNSRDMDYLFFFFWFLENKVDLPRLVERFPFLSTSAAYCCWLAHPSPVLQDVIVKQHSRKQQKSIEVTDLKLLIFITILFGDCDLQLSKREFNTKSAQNTNKIALFRKL